MNKHIGIDRGAATPEKENATGVGGAGIDQKLSTVDFTRVRRVAQWVCVTFKHELIAAVVVLAIVGFVRGGGL